MSQEKKYELAPQGYYTAEIENHALAETKDGKPVLKVKVRLQTLKKAKNGSGANFKPTSRIADLFFTDKTIEKTKKILTEAGFSGKSLAQLDPGHPQHVSLAGAKVEASVSHDTYEGKTRDKVSLWPASSSDSSAWMSNLKSASTTKVMQLDALFGSVKVDTAMAAPKKETKDEVPFGGDEFNW